MTSLFAIQYNLLLLILILIGLINVNNGDGNGKPNRRPEVASLVHTDLKLSPDNLPIFPERDDAVYFIVAVSGGAKAWGRTLARTLLDMGAPFSNPQGPPLRPIYVDLPQNGRFSVKVLTTLCEQIDGVPIAGMIVVGDGQSARSIALSGNSMKIPVLWAKGGTAHLHSGSEVQNYLQATLQPSAKEILEAIRAIFLQTHWHSFFVLSDIGSTMVLGGSMGMVLKKAPLSPTILPLSSNKDDVFRQLAKISRSTRGIVLLLCDLKMARRVMAEAQRLNMVGGHFIWIWADTSSTAEFYQPQNFGSATNVEEKEAIITAKENYDNHMDEYIERKSKYDHLDMPPTETRRPQNNTRYKQTNINRFHHIIGLRKGTDDDYGNSPETESIVGPKSFLKSVKSNKDEQIPMKEKRFNYNQKSTSSINNRSRIKQNNDNSNINNNFNSNENEFTSSVENSKANSLLHIKNINSDEFNANYYDSSSSSASIDSRNENFDNEYVELSANINKNGNGDFIDEFENVYGDYFGASYETMENVNPFVPTTTTTRRTPLQSNQQPTPPLPILTTTMRNFNINQQVNSKISTKSMERSKAQTKSLKSGKTSKIQDANKNSSNKSDNVNVDDDESVENSNDLKAKRANNFPTNPFNISSHVLFHHFKDFPVGLLALKPVKMNVDRHFIRSAIRLFASTWSRVDKDDEQRFMNRNHGKVVMNLDEWRNEYDEYEDNYGNNQKSTTSNQKSNKNNNNPNVNNRYSNRGRKFKRETVENKNKTSISNSVNSTLSSQTNDNINVNLTHYIVKQNNDELLSGLINNTKSNNNNTSSTNNNQNTINKETVVDVPLHGSIEVQKRQNTWWSGVGGTYRAKPDRQGPKGGRGTPHYRGGCFGTPNRGDVRRAESFSKYIREAVMLALSGKNIPGGMIEKPLISNFEILNLVPVNTKVNERKDHFKKTTDQKLYQTGSKWRRVGLVLGRKVHLDTIVWPGGDIVVSGLSARARSVFRVVTCLSPPFVMESSLDEDGLCLRGLPCHRLSTSGKHNLTLMFNSIETKERLEEDAVEHGNQIPINEDHKSNDKVSYITRCCYGLSMDLLENIASELGFEYHLYIVRDELFGTKQVLKRYDQQNQYQYSDRQENLELARDRERDREKDRRNKTGNFLPPNKRVNDNFVWNGIVGDLVSGSADMSFAPLSVSKARAEVIDFSVPFYHSGVSLLAAPKTKDDIPLLAFLLPFSPELWIAIFTFLNITAVAVAVYEWLSPFGLNPWGRQRSKNFSMSSALWVMWGLLCGHLVAFKAPKSWPNKFLINVWGGFSVIFVASYTANIAALIAGLFFHNLSHNYDTSLFNQRVGAPQASAAESYVQKYDKQLWEHMKKYSLRSIEEGIRRLKNGSIDLLLADAPILDYYRATDHGCTLRQIGDNYMEDTYAIGMTKGFPLKESISALIAKYSSNGYLDILAEKWYGGLPCYKSESDIEIVQPRPLGVAAVAGVFLLLGLGMILGVLILIFEHLFFKYTLPILRHQPKGTIWRSRNIMFFSQKLYRFINCVELVSPHHAARELVHTLRQGHITSLFQKSIKRKEDEQRRRRKSKAQFFEMIQEIRRVQQEEREQPTAPTLAVVQECEPDAEGKSISSQSSIKPKVSPKGKLFSLKKDGKSRSNSSGLNVRRFSTDSILGERLDTIGRRLSRDITNSPPDLGHRFETFGKSSSSKFDTFSGNISIHKSADNIVESKSKFDTFSGNIEEIKPALPAKKNAKNKQKRKPLNLEVFDNKTDKMTTFENQATLPLRDSVREPIKESVRESLQPPIFQLDSSKAILRERLHEELKAKYGKNKKSLNSVKPPRVPPANSHRQSNNISNDSYLKVQSSDALNVRPTPSPRQTKTYDYSTNDDDDDDDLDPMYASIQPKTNSRPKNNISLTKLSKEDLLKLSESTESEIHEFLNNSSAQTKSPDPT